MAMLLQELIIGIDWKRKTLHIYHDNDEAEEVVIDEKGSGVLKLEMFKALNVASLKDFMEELETLLTKDQLQCVFQHWGNSSMIMLSDVIGRGAIDRITAKEILALGMERGILKRGVNCTWKVIDREVQKTMKEKAERMKRGPIKEAATYEESVETLKALGFTIGKKGEGHDVVPSVEHNLRYGVEKGIKEKQIKAVEVIPENTVKGDTVKDIVKLVGDTHSAIQVGVSGQTSMKVIEDPRKVKKPLPLPVKKSIGFPKKKVT